MDFPDLNPRQLEAVKHLEGPLLVLAGAGSGKTRVVTTRIAHLLDIGILPSDILAVTFTNKAADEMQKRVKEITKSRILTCTFHSLGARILRESIEALGFKRDFTIYDDDDSYQLLKTCMNSLNIKDEKGLLKILKNKISQAKNELLSLEEALAENDPIFSKVFPLYQAKLKEFNAVDFDDLLYLTVKVLREHQDICNQYQNRWLFLLIDEFQDTNVAQYALTKILSAKHKNICVVGDPDQSIYSWRGARYQNILHFDVDFPDVKSINLEHNYRSTNTILSAANALIKHNPGRLEKNLWSQLGQGDKIGVFIAPNDRSEAQFVSQKLIQHHFDNKVPLSEIAIFYRTNAQSRIYEEALLAEQIPYVIYGGTSFYQRREIKDLLAYLRMVQSGSDFISFARTINIPKRGIGKESITKLLEIAEKTQTPILQICRSLNEKDLDIKLSSKQKASLLNYADLILSLKNSRIKIHELLSETIHRANYLTYLQEDPLSFEDRKENINELIAKAAEWEERTEEPSLEKFLEELSLLTSIEDKQEKETVKLMSLHHSKGLEFSLVFVVGLEEDLLPYVSAKISHEALEEERRLCYVGMTRAKKFLYLCASTYRFLWGSPRMMQPSRFLKEIPVSFLENLTSANREKEELLIEEPHSFIEGDRVLHKSFGTGTLLRAYTGSLGETFDVLFDDGEITRSLVAKYAKLQRAP